MAILGDGTIVQINDGGGATYATIPKVFDLDLPKPVAENVDITTFDSPAGADETMPATRVGRATYQFQSVYVKANFTRLKALERVAGYSIKVTFTDGATTTIPTSISSVTKDKIVVKDKVTFTTMCEVTGPIVEA